MLLHFASLFIFFALFPASYAHADIFPQLGVKGTPKVSDVKRPSGNQPCGDGVNITSALDTSTAVPADAKGNVKATVISFNGGGDGSRQVTAKVDPSGTGKNFVKMTVTVNGDPAPKNAGSQQVVATLPAGTKCTGGAKKNKCLAQFVTTSGFGSCVVVSQGGNNARDASSIDLDLVDREEDADAPSPATPANNKKEANGKKGNKGGKKQKKKKNGKKSGKDKAAKNAKVAAKNSGAEKGKGKKKNANKKKQGDGKKKQAGTRAARALLAALEDAE